MANKHYKITNWKGRKNFECLHCHFATLNRREISGHVDMHIRAGLAAKEVEGESVESDENYGLDVGSKSKNAKKHVKGIAKLAKKDAKEKSNG